ncbi:MAG: SpoIIE family protein phosphatase, partial [Leptospiraceae bacterium]|nr:SpoIIE family protein phosphatase [Leptospiraceae bacterium]
EFGEERLYSIFSENRHLSMEENVNKILKRLDQFIEGNEKEDDITVLGIEYK